MKYSILLILSIIILGACSKTTSPEWVVYYETSCYPAWTDAESDRRTKLQLEGYLKDLGIVPLKIKIEGERVPTCEFCDCSTGKSYEVQIDESQFAEISFLGFVRK